MRVPPFSVLRPTLPHCGSIPGFDMATDESRPDSCQLEGLPGGGGGQLPFWGNNVSVWFKIDCTGLDELFHLPGPSMFAKGNMNNLASGARVILFTTRNSQDLNFEP